MKFQASLSGLICALAVAAVPAARAAAASTASTSIPAPALPSILELQLEPASLVLQDGRDERRVLVWGKTDSHALIDLTAQASFQSESPLLGVDDQSYIHGKDRGTGQVKVSAAGLSTKLSVTVENATAPQVDFVRHVEPVLSKVGCNAGTCHGSVKGKNGFKLSLRGFDAEFDYQALINDISGRRFDRFQVDQSLLLLKPTAEVPHEGRQVIKVGSREYKVLHDWIAQGAKPGDLAAGRVKGIEILPKEAAVDLPGRSQQMLVLAHYADGTTRDVTRDAIFSISNTDVAEARQDGLIKSLRRGETAVLVRYEGQYAARMLTVMGDRTGYAWEETPEYNFIDPLVHAKLRKMKILPSEVCSDAEFIRRVFLDITGSPPAPDRVRAFLQDAAPTREKRDSLIEELLRSEDYVAAWSNRWADLLQCNSDHLGQKGVWLFRDWIRKNIAENTPYDQFVRSLLTAKGSVFENPAANYLRVLREPGKIAEDVSQTFLGVRFNCNKCHDHPFEKWTQNQYYQFGAYFAQVAFKKGSLGRENFRNNNSDTSLQVAEEILYRNYQGGEVTHPKTDKAVAPRVPFGTAKDSAEDGDRREPFVDWLTSKENPLFARAMANRLWSYFFGKGIIEPVDDVRASNPPSNPELLDALTAEFIRGGMDMKHLIRTICQSRTYQLSIHKNRWNDDDTLNFSHATPRRLSAEQILDALSVATGHKTQFDGMPAGMRSVQMADGPVAGNDFLALFGRPKRQSACECERTSNITLSHALNMINGHTISEAIVAPDNLIAKLVEREQDDKKVIEGIYLACLSRPPSPNELETIKLSDGASRLETAQDLTWALLNSPAFLFNR